jgi:lipopolysaccharide heptosyltransferase II
MASKRVAVLMKGFLGDGVMTTPMLDGLALNGAGVAIATSGPVFEMISPGREWLQHILSSRRPKMSATLREIRTLRQGNFSVAILVNRSFRSALIAKLAGIPVRSGHDVDRRGWLLTHKLPYDKTKFEAECYSELAREVGFPIPGAQPLLSARDDARREAADILQGATLAVQPGASAPWKRIPIPLLKQVVSGWSTAGYRIAVLGGKDELEASHELIRACDFPLVDLTGKTDIKMSMGILANLDLIVGGDTGLMHVAAATGCPTVTVFANQLPSKWGHQYAPHVVIQSPHGEMAAVDYEMLAPFVDRFAVSSKMTASPIRGGGA